MNKKLTICIDFDNTIINTGKTLVNLYNNKTGNKLKYNPDYKWSLEGLLPKDYIPRAFKFFADDIFYKHVEVFINAINVINKLSQRHRIIIVTKHCEERKINTMLWVKKNLPNVSIRFFNSFDKTQAKGDIFIDDRMDALDSVDENFNFRICYGIYDWNKEWSGIRITNWNDIEKFINTIEV